MVVQPVFVSKAEPEYFKAKIQVNPGNVNQVKDTLLTLSDLVKIRNNGTCLLQDLQGFQYPSFACESAEHGLKFSRGEMEIHLHASPFDSVYFFKNYINQPELYWKNLFFREQSVEFTKPVFLPSSQLSKILLKRGSQIFPVPTSKLRGLFEPDLECPPGSVTPFFGPMAWRKENGKILLLLECGRGASAHRVLLLFSINGKLEKWVAGPVL